MLKIAAMPSAEKNRITYRTAAVAPIVIRAYFSTCRILVKSCCPYEKLIIGWVPNAIPLKIALIT